MTGECFCLTTEGEWRPCPPSLCERDDHDHWAGSPMTNISRAIRLTLQHYAPTLRELDDDVLTQFVEIASAFNMDLRDEYRRRGLGS